ncbi:hypothetical protein Bbelb_215520 [Branchiostoma belcheri]|nr:hypothetical protein Bbelb_215520 [Branchiostoma belcheri]
MCAEGFWGKGCTAVCDCAGSHCDPLDGHCLCPAGYTGSKYVVSSTVYRFTGPVLDSCNETCPEGRYGSGCAESCSCENGGTCSPIDGTCSCLPGKTLFRPVLIVSMAIQSTSAECTVHLRKTY